MQKTFLSTMTANAPESRPQSINKTCQDIHTVASTFDNSKAAAVGLPLISFGQSTHTCENSPKTYAKLSRLVLPLGVAVTKGETKHLVAPRITNNRQ